MSEGMENCETKKNLHRLGCGTVGLKKNLSGPFFQKWENWGKKLRKNGKIKILKEKKLNSISHRSNIDRKNLFPWY